MRVIFYEPNIGATIQLFLRRPLVRSYRYSAFVHPHLKHVYNLIYFPRQRGTMNSLIIVRRKMIFLNVE